VHALRVALRTLLATLELASALEVRVRPRLMRHLEQVLDALSPLRDVHVQLRTLAKLERPAEETNHVREHLQKQKRKRARQARRGLSRLDGSKLERDVSEVTDALDVLHSQPGQRELTISALRYELASRHLRVVRRQQARPLDDAQHLHHLRLDVKRYRYALETLAPLLPAPGRALTKQLADLQDRLGDAHDAHVLAKTVQERAPEQKSLQAWLASRSTREQRAAAEAVAQSSFGWPLA
jgi:CHAD domain-containing protein